MYKNEKEGQFEFFDQFGIDYESNRVLIDYTDGVYNGTLFEFKLTINDINKVLFQAIKYLSRMRIKGEPVPANILLISLNQHICYHFKSENYFEEIHSQYVGSASIKNEGFNNKYKSINYDYSKESGANSILNILKKEEYLRINIDENCIVGWAEKYYRENPKATKADFIGDEKGVKSKVIGEIRKPIKFKDFILPYNGKSNEKFKYLMDKLNDRIHRRDLGAFYTPIPYCEKALELVRKAIKRVPKGNDYIILDRCAGTGNLEVLLTDEELSHCVLSTIEYFEYKVLLERIGHKVRAIIPPIENQVDLINGIIVNADAMSKQYIMDEEIKKYVNNKKCTIILYENPPYNDTSSITGVYEDDGKKHRTTGKESFVFNEMKKDKENFKNKNISTIREIANRFIWSGFKYYLRQNTDSYIVFSPIKYFKSLGLIKNDEKKFIKGYIFNRVHFHATAEAITCVLWANGELKNKHKMELEIFDIINDKVKKNGIIPVKKINSTFNGYQEKIKGKVLCDFSCDSYGNIEINKKQETKSYIDDNIIGYFNLVSASFDLGRLAYFNGRGFYLTTDNYYKKLPLFCAKNYPFDVWYEKGIYFCTSDNGDVYTKDKNFLKSCFIYSVLSDKNRMKTLKIESKKILNNELCFDDATIATKKIKTLKLTNEENELIILYNKILKEAKKTKKYISKYKYGIWQIMCELNTYKENRETKEKIYDYPQLNSDIITLKAKLKKYYDKNIKEKLFKYELLK